MVALVVAALGPEKTARVPATKFSASCDADALALCACELLPVVRTGDRVIRANNECDCALLDSTRLGVSNVNDFERIGRTGRVVAEAAGPFRSQVDAPDPFEPRSSVEELAPLEAQFAAGRVASE